MLVGVVRVLAIQVGTMDDAAIPAFQLGGTWTQDGQTKIVAQKTVVIPGSDGLYVLPSGAAGSAALAGNSSGSHGPSAKNLKAASPLDQKAHHPYPPRLIRNIALHRLSKFRTWIR